MRNNNRGYVGLVVILVATAILVFLYTKEYLTPTPQTVITPEGEVVATTSTGIEAAQNQIESANKVTEKINQQNQEINKVLGE